METKTPDLSLPLTRGGDKLVDIHTYEHEYDETNQTWLKEQGIEVHWTVTERNKYWHDNYFTKRACKDHQAKGNCRFVYMCIEELERRGWISPGDLVLDPMCGIGSFLIVAAVKKYNGVGIELEKRFYYDMIGWDENVDSGDEPDLFSNYVNKHHIVGNIENFHNLTALMPNNSIGRIAIINGDARKTHELITKNNIFLNSIGKLFAISSPPYGNRLSDVTQTAGADDGRTWEELEEESDGRRQYSNDEDNIGVHKIELAKFQQDFVNNYDGEWKDCSAEYLKERTEYKKSKKPAAIVLPSDTPQSDTVKAGEAAIAQQERNVAKLVAISSPPYSGTTEIGGQSKGGRLAELSSAKGVYSEGNIARHKLVTICSPPYSRSTEHNASQIEALPDGKVGGHRGFLYKDRHNIALLKIGQYDIAMQNVYKSLYKTLNIGSPVVLLTRNFIQEGKVVLLDELTIRLMEKAGFTYRFTKRAELPEISMFKYMNWNNCHREKNLPLITWEEASFFIKEK